MQDKVISLKQIASTLKQHLVMILMLTVCVGGVGAAIGHWFIQPEYESSALLLVNQKASGTSNDRYNQVQVDLQLINTYKDIITQPVILAEAAADLQATTPYNDSAAMLKKSLTVTNNDASQVVKLTAKAHSAKEAQAIANAVAGVFQNKITTIMANARNVSVIANAELAGGPVAPSTLIAAAVGALSGLFLGIGLAFVLRVRDRSIRDLDFITKTVGIPVLGSITDIPPKAMAFNQAMVDFNPSKEDA